MKLIMTVTPNPALDTVTDVDQVVVGRKLRCAEPTLYPGGGGLNVSRALHELGGESRAVWTCGGVTGETLSGLLGNAGIDHIPVEVGDSTREHILVLDRSADAFYRFGMPGPEITPDEADAVIRAVRDADPPPDYVVASGSLPRGDASDIYLELARVCAGRGSRMVLDTTAPELERVLEAEPVYLIKPNYHEFGELTGSEDAEEEEIVSRARALIEAGSIEIAVVTLGSAGSILVSAHEDHHVPAPTVRVKSRIGAGDSMVAGIVLGLARDRDVLDAVRYGSACAAAAVMVPGTELCGREDAERLYRHIAKSEDSGT